MRAFLLGCGAAGLLALASPAAAQQWVDVRTGQRVNSAPIVGGTADLQSQGRLIVATPDSTDPTRAFDSVTGRNFVFDRRRCQWIDSATGVATNSAPIVGGNADLQAQGRLIGATPDATDATRAFDSVTGRNFALDRRPCQQQPAMPPPPPPPVRTDGSTGALPRETRAAGFYVGLGEMVQRELDRHRSRHGDRRLCVQPECRA